MTKCTACHKLSTAIKPGCICFFLILIANAISWNGNPFSFMWRKRTHPCDEASTIHHQGQINSDFNELYGLPTINKSSSKLVNIFNTLEYGKQENAYHVNTTWVCIDENEEIVIHGAADDSVQFVQKYWVCLRLVFKNHMVFTILAKSYFFKENFPNKSKSHFSQVWGSHSPDISL